MGNERKSTCALRGVDEQLSVVGHGRQFLIGSEQQQVAPLRMQTSIVHLLTDQKQQLPRTLPDVALHSAHPDVVVCDNDGIQSGFQRRASNLPVATTSIGICRMHVEIDDDLLHGQLDACLG